MNLVDRSSGGLAVSELIAALHSVAPGSQVPLSPVERDAKARSEVRGKLAAFQKSATQLRADVRQPLWKPLANEVRPEGKAMGLKHEINGSCAEEPPPSRAGAATPATP